MVGEQDFSEISINFVNGVNSIPRKSEFVNRVSNFQITNQSPMYAESNFVTGVAADSDFFLDGFVSDNSVKNIFYVSIANGESERYNLLQTNLQNQILSHKTLKLKPYNHFRRKLKS